MRRPGRGFDLAVVGGGMTGLTAAHQAALRGLSVALLEPEDGLFGGQIANVGRLDGYPACEPVGGAALADALVRANEALGVVTVRERVTGLAPGAMRQTVETERGAHRAKQVIVASGARPKALAVAGEAALAGRGVSTCAWCDGGLYRGEAVVVVGGGDAAAQEALHLLDLGVGAVTLVTRGPRLRARAAYVARLADDARVRFRWNTHVEAVLGEQTVAAARLRDGQSGATQDVGCAGVFVFIGAEPNTQWLPAELVRDPEGRVTTDESLRTAVPGVYAAGAVRAGFLGQLTSAVGEGTAAAIAAVRAGS